MTKHVAIKWKVHTIWWLYLETYFSFCICFSSKQMHIIQTFSSSWQNLSCSVQIYVYIIWQNTVSIGYHEVYMYIYVKSAECCLNAGFAFYLKNKSVMFFMIEKVKRNLQDFDLPLMICPIAREFWLVV